MERGGGMCMWACELGRVCSCLSIFVIRFAVVVVVFVVVGTNGRLS